MYSTLACHATVGQLSLSWLGRRPWFPAGFRNSASGVHLLACSPSGPGFSVLILGSLGAEVPSGPVWGSRCVLSPVGVPLGPAVCDRSLLLAAGLAFNILPQEEEEEEDPSGYMGET